MATTLESLTKIYGATILFSSEFRSLLSKDIRKMGNIRCIDQVMNAVDKKYELYTFDMSDELYTLPQTNEIGMLGDANNNSREFYNMQIHKRFIKMSMLRDNSGSQTQNPFFKMFEEDLELSLACSFFQEKSPIKLRNQTFRDAFNLYIIGDWKQAEEIFQRILQDYPEDGPSKFLLKFIREKQGALTKRPPDDWMGYRKLWANLRID